MSQQYSGFLEGAFLKSGDAIFFLDRDGFIDCNDAALRLFGFTEKAEMMQLHPGALSPERQPDGRLSFESANAEMETAWANGHALIEWQHKRKDGTLFEAEVMLVGFSLDGRDALTATVRDVTRRRDAEEEVRRQREALHQSEKMGALGSLLAGVAHELNNPLAIVATQAALLSETSTDEKTLARAKKIETAADRCARIVKSFLAMARQRPAVREAFSLRDVVGSALDLTAYGLRTSSIKVHNELPVSLPHVVGDADQVSQIVLNLIINAQQALQKIDSKRIIRISGSASAEFVEVVIEDNGPGIAPDILSRIYDPFFTTKPVGAGTGIGLSVSRSIATAHQGSLDFRPSSLGGAGFALVLRKAIATDTNVDVAAAEDRQIVRKGSVLIVDDEADIIDALQEIIEPIAERIDTASSGREALKLVDGHKYDLLLSDLRMPDLDGPGLYKALQQKPEGRPKRTVFITGAALDQEVTRFLKTSGAEVIEKPFAPAAVRRVVLDALSDR